MQSTEDSIGFLLNLRHLRPDRLESVQTSFEEDHNYPKGGLGRLWRSEDVDRSNFELSSAHEKFDV